MATRSGGKGEERSNVRSTESATKAGAMPPGKGSTTGTAGQRDNDASATTASGSDRERELNRSREQGNVRQSSSTQRPDAGQERGGYSSPVYWTSSTSPFAMVRRMMEDMDRIFSDFTFTQPGILGSNLFGAGPWADEPRQRAIGGQSSPGSSLQTRGQQAPQRSAQRGLQTSALQSLWAPQVEVFERGNNLVVRADLPGLSREDVNVELEDEALIIRGERHSEFEDEKEGYYRSERSYGSFYRAIPLPDGIDASKSNATFKDGVLEVTMPKPAQQPSRARKIDVK